MKRYIVWLFSIFVLASCTSIQQMNSNLENANYMMSKNTEVMTGAKETISNNTEVVKESTAATKAFAGFMSIFMIIYFLILLVPAFILYRLYLRLAHSVRTLIDRQKK